MACAAMTESTMVVAEQASASNEERTSGGLKSFMTVARHSSSYQWNEGPFMGKVVPPVGPLKDSRPRVKMGSHGEARKTSEMGPRIQLVRLRRPFHPLFGQLVIA